MRMACVCWSVYVERATVCRRTARKGGFFLFLRSEYQSSSGTIVHNAVHKYVRSGGHAKDTFVAKEPYLINGQIAAILLN